MTEEKYYLDKNHLWGQYYLHYEPKFYNVFLNKFLKIISNKSEEYSLFIENNKTIQRIYIDEVYELLNTRVVEVVLKTDKNIIQVSRDNKKVYDLYKNLLQNDYVLYYHANGISRLYKREFIHELWKRKDLYKQGDLFYTLDSPQDKKVNSSEKSKITSYIYLYARN